ncbi:hypothetical protein DACRYDRAFT_25405 [Dacryopinax primogenitus]|uniref:Uncharacterized protein n=1 Tax=Dacryopinax primogenitus (strain DJM 731) TaxID=1858805 RepID=M5FZN3_DACPD|nr:uncharacterized protein DACRYDRAFT_25405 [Dacryopinax primogenitus]EJT96967.1 hypothetical protein DACRYDRAFT_25405 [Dacryopinax primogenitus]
MLCNVDCWQTATTTRRELLRRIYCNPDFITCCEHLFFASSCKGIDKEAPIPPSQKRVPASCTWSTPSSIVQDY